MVYLYPLAKKLSKINLLFLAVPGFWGNVVTYLGWGLRSVEKGGLWHGTVCAGTI